MIIAIYGQVYALPESIFIELSHLELGKNI